MKCKDVYKKQALNGEWITDNYEHEEIIYCDGDFVYKRCEYCLGKIASK